MNPTLQQAFDAAWHGLKGQGFRSVPHAGYMDTQSDGFCLLCAIAHVDKVYGKTKDYLPFMALIDCHDDADSPADMERRLREYAASNQFPIPDEKPAQTFQSFMAKALEPVDVTEGERHAV